MKNFLFKKKDERTSVCNQRISYTQSFNIRLTLKSTVDKITSIFFNCLISISKLLSLMFSLTTFSKAIVSEINSRTDLKVSLQYSFTWRRFYSNYSFCSKTIADRQAFVSNFLGNTICILQTSIWWQEKVTFVYQLISKTKVKSFAI